MFWRRKEENFVCCRHHPRARIANSWRTNCWPWSNFKSEHLEFFMEWDANKSAFRYHYNALHYGSSKGRSSWADETRSSHFWRFTRFNLIKHWNSKSWWCISVALHQTWKWIRDFKDDHRDNSDRPDIYWETEGHRTQTDRQQKFIQMANYQRNDEETLSEIFTTASVSKKNFKALESTCKFNFSTDCWHSLW